MIFFFMNKRKKNWKIRCLLNFCIILLSNKIWKKNDLWVNRKSLECVLESHIERSDVKDLVVEVRETSKKSYCVVSFVDFSK